MNKTREEETALMQILSHRGYWTTAGERNTEVAFERSFARGFGTETDVRDWNGSLVISHDPPTGRPLLLEVLLDQYQRSGGGAPLALNIKADGLCDRLQSSLAEHGISNYFVFDMSVPDALQYVRSMAMPLGSGWTVSNGSGWMPRRWSGIRTRERQSAWFPRSCTAVLICLSGTAWWHGECTGPIA
jgi:glycerophosphoryl diester phosphodiesterase